MRTDYGAGDLPLRDATVTGMNAEVQVDRGMVDAAGPVRRVRGASRVVSTGTLVAGLASGALLASLSMVVVSLVVRVVLGPGAGALSLVLIAVGTLVGAGVGSWLVQPLVARLLDAVRERAGDARGQG